MTTISQTEENYLKAIFKLSEKADKAASTNAISNEIKTSAASVTDMLKRLADKGLIFSPWKCDLQKPNEQGQGNQPPKVVDIPRVNLKGNLPPGVTAKVLEGV